MSIFKTNKFFRVIKHFILALPLMFVLGVSLYAIVNPNAFENYNGSISYQRNVAVDKPTDLISDETYIIKVIDNVSSSVSNASYRIGFSSFTLKDYLLENGFTSISSASYFTIGGAVGYTDRACFAWYDDNMVYLNRTELPLSNDIVNNLSFVFTDLNTSSSAYFTDTFKGLINVLNNIVVYNNTLNFAFEHAMVEFTQIGFGQFDFISFFNGIFTTNINNVYATFINDYINYYLFVELIYFAPWVFHMFIHFAYDLGDYFTSSFKRNRKEDD